MLFFLDGVLLPGLEGLKGSVAWCGTWHHGNVEVGKGKPKSVLHAVRRRMRCKLRGKHKHK